MDIQTSIFGDSEVLLVDYLTKGQTITGPYYANLFRQLRDKILKNPRRRKLSLGVLFHQDNAQAHNSTVALGAIHDCGFQPELAPSNYYLFPRMKKELSGQHFATNNDVIDTVDVYLGDRDSSFYEEGIHKLHKRWTKCVNLQGDYVEK